MACRSDAGGNQPRRRAAKAEVFVLALNGAGGQKFGNGRNSAGHYREDGKEALGAVSQ